VKKSGNGQAEKIFGSVQGGEVAAGWGSRKSIGAIARERGETALARVSKPISTRGVGAGRFET